jgi:hypothetical protein
MSADCIVDEVLDIVDPQIPQTAQADPAETESGFRPTNRFLNISSQ